MYYMYLRGIITFTLLISNKTLETVLTISIKQGNGLARGQLLT